MDVSRKNPEPTGFTLINVWSMPYISNTIRYLTIDPPMAQTSSANNVIVTLKRYVVPRYDGTRLNCTETGNKMTTTFEAVAEIISETSDIPLEEITPEKNAFTDLGIDSLDFLDIAFAIDKNFGIKIPLEKWTEELNENKASVDEYFILSKLCTRIDELIAAKDA